jgi:hypothetical protein
MARPPPAHRVRAPFDHPSTGRLRMFTVSPQASRTTIAPAPTSEDFVAPAEYLTDGVTLFRFLRPGAGGMVELEDCRTLDVLVIPALDIPRMNVVNALNNLP